MFTFIGLQERPDGGFRFAVYGDMGNINARSLGKIQRLAQDGDFDMILHVGDLAYNLDSVSFYFYIYQNINVTLSAKKRKIKNIKKLKVLNRIAHPPPRSQFSSLGFLSW